MVPARFGTDAEIGKETVFTDTTDAMQILGESDSGGYVPSCGQTPPGSSAAMEVSDRLVYHVERLTAGLFRTSQEWP